MQQLPPPGMSVAGDVRIVRRRAAIRRGNIMRALCITICALTLGALLMLWMLLRSFDA
ncbi:MAG: hypothetical protein ACPGZP_00050 [Panacagrimonas sp.]